MVDLVGFREVEGGEGGRCQSVSDQARDIFID